jgi:hypothetical protein
MIVRILSRGKSFKGLATYLTHDADQAKTSDRVAWTHTRNLANDEIPSAVNEMLWTARDAELLKQEAGVRAGGRTTANQVKHLSLNWSPEDRPTPEHMRETTDGFLRHMKWEEHQAIVVAHNDKAYAHVHVMLNAVHPETGLRLNDDFERRRAQTWARDYEREQGRIYCEQRLLNPEEREPAPPRNIWMAMQENQKEFAQAEIILAENSEYSREEPINRENSEWEILKENQRTERISFFADGKSQFSELRTSIYREIRQEFRSRWADYFTAAREGADPDMLAELKAGIIADQTALLDARRAEACAELREARDERYRGLLDNQSEVRADLRWSQDVGLDNAAFLSHAGERDDVAAEFGEAGDEVATRFDGGDWNAADDDAAQLDHNAPQAEGDHVGTGEAPPGLALLSIFGFALDDLINFGSKPVSHKPDPETREQMRAGAEEATKRRRREEEEEAHAESRRKQRERSYGE